MLPHVTSNKYINQLLQMAEKITNVVPSETSDNDISNAMEGNDKTRNKNEEKPLPDELASFTSIIVSAIDDIRNIKSKCPDIDAIYRYVSKNMAANVDRDFIETIVVHLVNKNIIFNKPTAEGSDSYFIVNPFMHNVVKWPNIL